MSGAREKRQRSNSRPPLIAIGASAGGLEPLEAFFRHAPDDAGWSYVVIQHLSPNRESMMDEILGRRTGLRIRRMADGMTLEPNTIYLNVPDCLAELDGDTFVLTPFDHSDTLPHLPIDAFFYSIAAHGAESSCAIVLSGSGGDGSAGALEVSRTGGTVIVQTPNEAKFDSMPLAAIGTGASVKIMDAAEMPTEIAEIFDSFGKAGRDGLPEPAETPSETIVRLLEEKHGVDFAAYKRPTVMRRIERRHLLRGLKTIDQYRDLIAADPDALEELYHDLLIGVTEFYRDPEAFASLRRLALSKFVTAMQSEMREIRVWVLACASGEEAYTIAMELSEVTRLAGVQPNFRVIATDVHRPSIERAAQGVYPEDSLNNIPTDLRDRYFLEHRNGAIVDPLLRRRVIFSVHDALRDPPFMQLDLICCRNLLIYLKEAAQDRIISKFLFGLRKNGFMFLGPSESVRRKLDDFAPVDQKWRIYRKVSDRRVIERSMLVESLQVSDVRSVVPMRGDLPSRPPVTMVEQTQGARRDRDSLLRGYDALLRRYAPSSILITSDGSVLTWFGSAGAYVDTMSDLADWTVEEIIHADLRYAINMGVVKIANEGQQSFARNVTVTNEAGETHSIKLTMEPLGGSLAGRRFLLVKLERFEIGADAEEADPEVAGDEEPTEDDDTDDGIVLMARVRELERDLRLTEESLQYVTERLEASGEELQASNEELQASNEELQASNEELQASNEELHAVNEELISLSAEHERKIELLSELNHDTELVFEKLGIGLVILDVNCRIRRYTVLCGDVFELEPQDVGRPISNVGARPGFADPAELARIALDEGREQSASGNYRGGALEIRAVPFKSRSRPRSGAVLLFSGTTFEEAAAARVGAS